MMSNRRTAAQPRVSIIIPTYNHAQYLGEAITSALGQSRPADEIIVIDNGSTDNTPEIARGYPVRYVRQDNQGICGSANRGIREATGDYLVILHSDDRLLPHHVATSLVAFQEHPEAAFVCGDYRWFGAADTWHKHRCSPSPDYYATLLRFNFIGPPVVVMFKKAVLDELGGFRPEFAGADDQEIYLRIARHHAIHCHHEVVAEYRRHPGQDSRNIGHMLDASIRMLRAQFPYVVGNPVYEQAYRDGLRYRRTLYSETIFWQGVGAAKAHQWHRAFTCFSTLFRHNRLGLIPPTYRRYMQLPRRPLPVRPS